MSLSAKLMRGAVAFTLAETLIALGIIGVVAAVTLPTLFTNVQERIRNEQVRTVKYKLTLATDKMKSMGLITSYNSTQDFVNELKNHFKIAKICDSNSLEECWPTKQINIATANNDSKINVKDLKTGNDLSAIPLGMKNSQTAGIVTADGTSIILAYSQTCIPLDAEKTYPWSIVNNKPETNATTNCISAIFDINGKAKPNRIGQDVRTLNSILGSVYVNRLQYGKVDESDKTDKLRKKLGLNWWYSGDDYYAGARRFCMQKGLHMASMQTLANIMGSHYGVTNMPLHAKVQSDTSDECTGKKVWKDSRELVCVNTSWATENPPTLAVSRISHSWSSSEVSSDSAETWAHASDTSGYSLTTTREGGWYLNCNVLCVAD